LEKNQLHLFENTEIAYRDKSDSELKRAYFLFRLMNQSTLVKWGNHIISFCLKLKLPIQFLVKNTIFSQFCGGETLDATQKVIERLKRHRIDVLLNYSVEGLEDATSYKFTFEKTLEAISFAKEHASIRAICIKFTGFAKMAIWIKLQEGTALNEAETQEYQQAKYYIDTLCQEAIKSNVQLYVDAEESWFQQSIDTLVDDLMQKYNRSEAYIFNTYQLYRNDKLVDLKKAIENAQNNDFILGAKVVRGAYVEKENRDAQDHD